MKNPLAYLHPKNENAILIYLSLLKFIALIIFAGNYGLFRDEYYYVECSKHLSWGYVDQPPLSIFILWISRNLFGDSLLGIRIFAYITSSATVFLSGIISREMNGGKYSQALTATAAAFSGVILGSGGLYSMNTFDIFLSALMFYFLVKLLKTNDKKLWIPIGIIFGIGLMNKLTFLFLGFGLVVGLLLTRDRKYFLTKELWIAGALALIIFLPHIIWQFANGFPTIEFMRNAAERKNVSLSVIQFFTNSLMELHPLSTLLLIAAFYFLFFHKDGRKFILIALLYLSVFLVFVFRNGKPYYMGVLYPVILAAGSVGVEQLIKLYLKPWVRYAVFIFLLPGYFFAVPFSIPVFDVDGFVKLSEESGIKPASGERSELGILPQFYADRFGWKEMVEDVAKAYNQLSPEEKKKALVFGQNYGEASAVNYYRGLYNLPEAISSHNSYWIWGVPKNYDGQILIVIGSNLEDNREYFEDVQLAVKHYNKYGMPYENVDIFICRKPKVNIHSAWPRLKFFI
jgi:hypothetical protein